LTEGRRAFLERVAGIESGAECERLAPALSMVADGEASAEDMANLRPHLRSCLSCRATLRAFRDLPHRAAEVVPVAAAADLDGLPAMAQRWAESLLGWVQERATLVAGKLQASAEASSASKAAAVAASAATLAAGTVAVSSMREDEPARGTARVVQAHEQARPQPAAGTADPAAPATAPPVASTPAAVEVAPPPAVPLPAGAIAPITRATSPVVRPAPLAPIPSAASASVRRFAAATPPPTPAPPPDPNRSIPSSLTIPVNFGESAIGANEEERTLDPLTRPMEEDPPEEPPAPGADPADSGAVPDSAP
jgi:hypothetical protein